MPLSQRGTEHTGRRARGEWRAGFASRDLTVHDPRLALLGWGRSDQRPVGVAHPLRVRAAAIRSPDGIWVHACLDLCFVGSALRAAVLDALPLPPAALTLSATHTHSGPSGYLHAFFYDLAGPGFSPPVFRGLRDATVAAVEEALAAAAPAVLRYGAAKVAAGVAHNRSLAAFRANPEGAAVKRAPEAVDRTLHVLRADDLAGRPLGAMVWFALHATSIHGDGRLLHPDHKGLAAERFRRWARCEAGAADRFEALFAQGAAGDVTPNHRHDRRRGVTAGATGDDEADARAVAAAEVEAAARAFRAAGPPLSGPLRAVLQHVDLEGRPVPGGRTTEARLGLAMARGTAEGPGPLAAVPRVLERVRRSTAPRDPKIPLLRVGPRPGGPRLLGALDPTRLPALAPALRRAARMGAAGAAGGPWIATVLPVQWVRLGPLGLAFLPNEPTTVAGWRLARRLARPGLRAVLVLGYANAYAGYLTTPEEYALQRYEGAYTLFGPHTFAAFAEVLEALARAEDDPPALGPPLQVAPPAVLRARAV